MVKVSKINLLFFTFFTFSFFAQSYSYKQIAQKDGLPTQSINTIFKDSRNLFWLGNNGAGLTLYNGNQFITYNNFKNIENFFVVEIIENHSGQLLVSDNYKGLFVFDKNKFVQQILLPPVNHKTEFIQRFIKVENGIYALSANAIYFIDKNNSIKRNLLFSSFKIETITGFLKENDSCFYFSTNKGVFYFNGKKVSIVKDITTECVFSSGEKQLLGTETGNLFSILKANNGSIVKSILFSKVTHNAKIANFKHISTNKNGKIWFTTHNDNSLGFINNKNKVDFKLVLGNFNKDKINDLFIDDQFAYFATQSNGIIEFSEQKLEKLELPNEFSNDLFYVNCKIKNSIFVYSKNEGIKQFEEDNNTVIYKKTLPNSINKNIFLKNNYNQLVVADNAALYLYENGTFLNKVNFVDIKNIFQDSKNRYWVSSTSKGLLLLDRNFNKIDYFFNNTHVQFSIENDLNKFYVGTGIGIFEISENKQNDFKFNKILPNFSYFATKDLHGTIWISAESNLISITNKGKIQYYNSLNKIRSTLIYTLTAFENYIYIGSNLGIDKIKTFANGTLSNQIALNTKYGFNNLETNTNGCSVDKNGILYFSTNQGLFKYSSKAKNIKHENNTILITNIILGNEAKNFNNWLNLPKSNYIIPADIDDVIFQIGQTSSISNISKYYSTKIVNFSENWSKPSTNKSIAYYQIEPGNYEFQVKEVTLDGQTISKTQTFPFSISIPFYNTWWFLGIVLILFGFLAYFILTKTAFYNKDFVKTQNENSYHQINQNVLLNLSVVLFITGTIAFLNNLISSEEFFLKTIMVAINLTIYFFYESKLVKKQFNTILQIITFGITFALLYNLIFVEAKFIVFSELLIICFFSYNLINKFNHYLVYNGVLLFIFITLFIIYPENKSLNLSLIGSLFLIIVINFYRRIDFLNTNDKLLFTNQIINEANVLTIATDNLGNIKFCSNSITKILGYNATEILNTNFWELTLDNDLINKDYNLIYKPNTLLLRKLKTKNNNYIYIEWSIYKNDSNLFISIGIDVTKRIESESYQNIVSNAADIIYEMDNKGNVTYINEAGLNIFNTTSEAIFGKNLYKYLNKDYKEKVFQFYRQVENKTEFDLLEFPIKVKNKTFWFSQKVVINRNEANKIIGFSAIVRDISNAKNETDKLRLREQKMELFNETLNKLTTQNFSNFSSLDKIIENIIKQSSNAIHADRINYWENKPENVMLICGINNNEIPKKTILNKNKINFYIDVLQNKNVEDVSNKNNHAQFIKYYTSEFQIKSMLDFPIYIQGELVGLICFENTLKKYNWDEFEINFAKTITDIITLNIESFYKREAQKQTQYKSELLIEISNVTKQLLVSNDLPSIFNNCKNFVENILKVDRFYYYESIKNKVFNHKIEWDKLSTELLIDRSDLQNLKHNIFSIFTTNLYANKPILGNLSEMTNPKVIELYNASNIKSKLIFPIFKEDEFTGTIGFDVRDKERIWQPEEIISVQLLVNNISATLTRLENQNIFKEKELAQAANKSKSEFLANMSHEIRTPLNGIIGFSELLLNTKINLTQKEYLQNVNKSAINLSNIVNDILDISKIEAGKLFLDLKEINLIETIYHVTDLVKFNANQKNIQLIISIQKNIPNLILLDDFRLKQILINLLNNAIKFTIKGEIEIAISVIKFNITKVKLKFEVIDTGIGIKPENKSKILNAFTQEDSSTTRNFGGTGLGLSITNSLLKLMNSKIQIKNNEPNGSNFYFEIETKISKNNFETEYKNQLIKTAIFIEKNIKTANSLMQYIQNYNILCKHFTNFEIAELNNLSLNDLLFVDFKSVNLNELQKIIDIQKTIKFTLFIMNTQINSEIEDLLNSKIKFLLKPFYQNYLQKQILKINQLDNEIQINNSNNVTVLNPLKIIILIVEDNKINMLLTKTLVLKIYPLANIIQAENGQIGIEKYIKYKPNIVLMDLQMPIKNGYEASIEILKINPNAKIIAISAGIFEEENVKCKEIGITDFLIKPLDKILFEEKLLNIIN